MIEIFAGIALIVLATAVCKHVEQRAKHSVSNDAEERLTARIQNIERRLTDIQDVMIAIDEKLDRSPVGL
jgi:Flp pilus assembly protein TadB